MGFKRPFAVSAQRITLARRELRFVDGARQTRSPNLGSRNFARSTSNDTGRNTAPSLRSNGKHFDVVVVGSGGAGLTAAVVAARHGLRALVLEKSGFIGGTTAFSGGGIWIPNNRYQKKLGIKDGYRSADTYLRAVLGNELYQHDVVDAFLRRGPEMLEWMEDNTHVRFKGTMMPDYHTEKSCTNVGRTLLTEKFDGRKLGRQRLRSIRYTLDGYHAFGSMQAAPSELAILSKPFQSPSNLAYAVRRILRYGLDVLRYGKGSDMANGNALVGQLVKSCDDAGVVLRTHTEVTGLERQREGGGWRVGIKDHGGRGEDSFVVANSVVLASGGFGRAEYARNYLPHDWCVQPRHNVGDGQRMAVELGAQMPPPNRNNGIFAPISLLRTPSGQVRRFPHFSTDRNKPGSVIVGPNGRRFANEAEPYHDIVQTMHSRRITQAYLIGDSRFLKAYGMGIALPWPMSPAPLIRQGYLTRARTIGELAGKLGVPASVLNETISKTNENAARGLDPDYHRGKSSYDLFLADPSAGFPNPSLGTCIKPPYYAVTLYPGNVGSTYGLETDTNAQALDTKRNPIPGLYAVGADANSIMRGEYPGGGSSIGPGMNFAYIAGLHIAGLL